MQAAGWSLGTAGGRHCRASALAEEQATPAGSPPGTRPRPGCRAPALGRPVGPPPSAGLSGPRPRPACRAPASAGLSGPRLAGLSGPRLGRAVGPPPRRPVGPPRLSAPPPACRPPAPAGLSGPPAGLSGPRPRPACRAPASAGLSGPRPRPACRAPASAGLSGGGGASARSRRQAWSAARWSSAMSSFFMPIMASIARCAAWCGVLDHLVHAAGDDLPRHAEPVLEPAARALRVPAPESFSQK